GGRGGVTDGAPLCGRRAPRVRTRRSGRSDRVREHESPLPLVPRSSMHPARHESSPIEPAASLASRDELARSHLADEPRLVDRLRDQVGLTVEERRRIGERAGRLARAARANRSAAGVEAFLQEYSLTSSADALLMCLA